VTSQPRAFFALDIGSATTSAALIGHVGGRWRLVAHRAGPATVPSDAVLLELVRGVGAADPDILAELANGEDVDPFRAAATWPRVEARSSPVRQIAVLAGTRKQRARLEAVANRSGWRVVGASLDDDDPVAIARQVLSAATYAVLLGADHSPSGEEKRHLPDLAALLVASIKSRPDLTVVLAGGAAAYESLFLSTPVPLPGAAALPRPNADQAAAEERREQAQDHPFEKVDEQSKHHAAEGENGNAPEESAEAGEDRATVGDVGADVPEGIVTDAPTTDAAVAGGQPTPEPTEHSGSEPKAEPQPSETAWSSAAMLPADSQVVAHVLLAPDVEAGSPAGSALQQVLEGLRAVPNDGRLGVARSIASLSYLLDRSIEIVEVGLQGGLLARSEPFGGGHSSTHAATADGAFVPERLTDDVIDGVAAWSTVALDRHGLMDRLNDLRVAPWGNAAGDGATLRLAAAKAALARLVAATPEISVRPMPEMLVAAGGIFASLPPSVVALAVADIIRRPGTTQLVGDPARLLGPLGTIEDEGERRLILANLADDILMPLGSLVMPSGVRPGKSAGKLRLKGAASIVEIELHPGAVQVVDLPAGRTARADLEFRDAVRVNSRGHRFSLDVTGGLVGLLVDLRDIPMRISDRPDSRRAALEAWQKGMWPEVDE
jgi:hypothetical protein